MAALLIPTEKSDIGSPRSSQTLSWPVLQLDGSEVEFFDSIALRWPRSLPLTFQASQQIFERQRGSLGQGVAAASRKPLSEGSLAGVAFVVTRREDREECEEIGRGDSSLLERIEAAFGDWGHFAYRNALAP